MISEGGTCRLGFAQEVSDMNASTMVSPRWVGHHRIGAKRRDFYDRYDVLLANWYLLTGRIQEEVQALRQDLHDDLGRWRPHQPEPDWSRYADRVNAACREGGLKPVVSAIG
jgi:hypothetical protein